MGAAVAVLEPADRPGWLEKVLVLGICAGLLAGVNSLDTQGRERQAARAKEVLAERAARAAQRSAREAMTAPALTPAARTDRLGRRSSPIVVPAGPAWGPASSVVSRTQQRAAVTAPGASGAADPGRSGVDSALLLLMGAAGLSMSGAGLRLLSRRSA